MEEVERLLVLELFLTLTLRNTLVNKRWLSMTLALDALTILQAVPVVQIFEMLKILYLFLNKIINFKNKRFVFNIERKQVLKEGKLHCLGLLESGAYKQDKKKTT